jgi:hypothetical protein
MSSILNYVCPAKAVKRGFARTAPPQLHRLVRLSSLARFPQRTDNTGTHNHLRHYRAIEVKGILDATLSPRTTNIAATVNSRTQAHSLGERKSAEFPAACGEGILSLGRDHLDNWVPLIHTCEYRVRGNGIWASRKAASQPASRNAQVASLPLTRDGYFSSPHRIYRPIMRS